MNNFIQPLDIAGSYGRGRLVYEAGQEANRRNALEAFLQQNGGALMQGDQNALAAYAGFDPAAAFQMQSGQQRLDLDRRQTEQSITASKAGMANDAARLDILRKETAQRAAEHAAKMSEIERAQAVERINTALAQATQAQTAADWDRIMSSNPEAKDYVGQFDRREEIFAGVLGVKDAMEMAQGPEPQSSAGKFFADQNAGLIPPDVPFKGDGVTVNNNMTSDVGTIPPGYELMTDPNTGGRSMRLIPGSPQAMEADAAADKLEKQGGSKAISTDVILDAAQQARQIAQGGSLPTTGPVGQISGNLAVTQAAELRRQTAVLTSVATLENLNAMRQSSPTGGALGNVTEGEGRMLAAAAGALDPNSSREDYLRQLDNYERTLLRIVHGPVEGDRLFNATRGAGELDEEQLDSILQRYR